MNNEKRARVLPFLGDAEQGNEETSSVKDTGGFVGVLQIFARTWPFLLPYIQGYWRELSFKSSGKFSPAPDSDVADDSIGWSFYHVPPLVTLTVVLGPLLGLIEPGLNWLHDFVFGAAIAMCAVSWLLLIAKGRAYIALSIALVLLGTLTFLFAVLALDGVLDNLFIALVIASCICIWVLQYRIEAGKLLLRVRVGSHLVYYFVLLWASTLLLMLIALFSVDVVSQSILQAKPLTPFVAELVGQPDLAGVPESPEATAAQAEANIELAPLSDEQRHSLKWVYAAFLLLGWVAQIPIAIFLPYYYIYIMQRVNQDLRLALLTRWHRLSLRYHSDHRVGDSVYRLYQDSAMVTAVIGEITQVLQVIITYFTGVTLLLALDPVLGLMALSIVLLSMLWGLWFSPRMRDKSLLSRMANSDFTSRVQETFASIRIIKAYGSEDREQARFEKDSIHAFNASYRVRSLTVLVGIVTFTIAAAALLYGQFLTAIWAQGERETFATVLVALVGLSFVRWNLSAYQSAQEQLGASSVAVRDLVERWARAQDMAMGLNRVFDILDIEPDVQNRPNAMPFGGMRRGIEFDNVSFAYEASRPVLQDVSFDIKPGSVTAIVGPTGSGKSSLMSLLSRLFDPDSGQIRIDGIDIQDFEVDSLRQNISVALQENVLFGMSLRENIRYVAPMASDEAVLDAVRVACVEEYIAELPQGLDTQLSDRGGKLSTGQRQRLSIARAVVKNTPILILDEPTAALDARTEHQVLQRLAEWGEDRAIFLITHRISTIKQADQILYIDQGQLIEKGSHDDLMQLDGGRYRNFVETEARLSQRSMQGIVEEGQA